MGVERLTQSVLPYGSSRPRVTISSTLSSQQLLSSSQVGGYSHDVTGGTTGEDGGIDSDVSLQDTGERTFLFRCGGTEMLVPFSYGMYDHPQ